MVERIPKPQRAITDKWTNWPRLLYFVRVWSGQTQEQFAQHFDASRSGVAMWERGRRGVPDAVKTIVAREVILSIDEVQWLDQQPYEYVQHPRGRPAIIDLMRDNSEQRAHEERQALVGAFINRVANGPLSDAEAALWDRLLVDEPIATVSQESNGSSATTN